jgi:CheY-like chemotaxis protein
VETSLFLHRESARMGPEKRQILERIYQSDTVLEGKTVLIVDDDIRNIFALTAALEQHGLRILSAENGRTALEILGAESKIDMVLMDIMMPEMDGYETTRAIRQQPQFKALPIIALTAKAMKGDREKCLAAGTSDYVAKPVNMDQLLSLMRVWLYK